MPLSNKQKRHLKTQAQKWLKFKLKVESPFKKELKSYFFQQSKIIDRGSQLDTISPILDKHYKRIVREMTGIRLKADTDDYGLEDSLLLLLFGRSVKQAQFIDKTTQQKLRLAVELARQNLAEDGILFPSQTTLNKVTANIFKSLNRGRVGGIAVYETQSLTEKVHDVKQTIANDIINDAIINNDEELGQRAYELSESLTMKEVATGIGSVPASTLFTIIALEQKAWVTIGDSRVRPWHEKANWQIVSVNEPFTVRGELLMYPGDSSMGASMGNLANCRCHASRL